MDKIVTDIFTILLERKSNNSALNWDTVVTPLETWMLNNNNSLLAINCYSKMVVNLMTNDKIKDNIKDIIGTSSSHTLKFLGIATRTLGIRIRNNVQTVVDNLISGMPQLPHTPFSGFFICLINGLYSIVFLTKNLSSGNIDVDIISPHRKVLNDPPIFEMIKSVNISYNKNRGIKPPIMIANLTTDPNILIEHHWDSTNAPINPPEVTDVKYVGNQDIFSIYWCMYIIKEYIRVNGNMIATKQFIRDFIVRNPTPLHKLVFIKMYIMNLMPKIDIRFMDIWDMQVGGIFGLRTIDTINNILTAPRPSINIELYQPGTTTLLSVIDTITNRNYLFNILNIQNPTLVSKNVLNNNVSSVVLLFFISIYKNDPPSYYTKYTDGFGRFKLESPKPCDITIDKVSLELENSVLNLAANPLTCANIGTKIIERNDKFNIFNNSNPGITGGRCNIGTINLEPYQAKALNLMETKSPTGPTGLTGPPGLLVWFSTGTGKTLTAGYIVRKLVACENKYSKCFIITTKSVIDGFYTELVKGLDMYLDKITPLNQDETISGKTFYTIRIVPPHGGPIDIFLYTKDVFQAVYTDKYTNEIKNLYDFRDALMIIDEAHKIYNTKLDPNVGTQRFFTLCCNNSRQVMLMTATPMINSIGDMDALLTMLDKPVRPIEDKIVFASKFAGEISITDESFCDICNDPLPVDGHAICELTIADFTPASTISNPATGSPANYTDTFGGRIIKYPPFGSPPDIKLPPYIEQKLCITANDKDLRRVMIDRGRFSTEALTTSEALTKSQTNSFGSAEIEHKNTFNYKLKTLLKLIELRETTGEDSSVVLSGFGIDNRAHVPPPVTTTAFFTDIKFKYVVYCSSIKDVDKIKTALADYRCRSLPPLRNMVRGGSRTVSGTLLNCVGQITGEDETTKRSNTVNDYNMGKIKILIITDAAMEGVDLRKTSMVILFNPVWTKSDYDQIIGRGVRLNSGRYVIDNTNGTLTIPGSGYRYANINKKDYDSLVKQLQGMGLQPNGLTHGMNLLNAWRSGSITKANLITALTEHYTSYTYTYTDGQLIHNLNIDMSSVSTTVQCITMILSYNSGPITGIPAIGTVGTKLNAGDCPLKDTPVKFSIDTNKFNYMRLKNVQIQKFTEILDGKSLLGYP